jgi:hypothetical protein
VKKIRDAALDELTEVIGKDKAEKVFEFFNGESEQKPG